MPAMFLVWFAVGAVAGFLASIVMDARSAPLYLASGIIGSIASGYLFSVIDANADAVPWSAFVAFLGAVVLIGLFQLFVGDRPPTDDY